jgi:hypothetical protein
MENSSKKTKACTSSKPRVMACKFGKKKTLDFTRRCTPTLEMTQVFLSLSTTLSLNSIHLTTRLSGQRGTANSIYQFHRNLLIAVIHAQEAELVVLK